MLKFGAPPHLDLFCDEDLYHDDLLEGEDLVVEEEDLYVHLLEGEDLEEEEEEEEDLYVHLLEDEEDHLLVEVEDDLHVEIYDLLVYLHCIYHQHFLQPINFQQLLKWRHTIHQFLFQVPKF
ncbi:hypothetical protein WICMUC_000882 [Wickerhamomyces mucosus]|uniref:Uncharacterized protein n=1 Tax=Wickerhamomyces mucosus TaxID=1378264 RepID=A0A9P8TI05_9ASCO|nr:hypothetical protein WICMUC_000882 [Wickerhamomyces mucosus]